MTGEQAVSTREVAIGEIDLASTLRSFLMLPSDPTVAINNNRFERSTLTPDGIGSIRVEWGDADAARITTWGPGGRWLLDRSDGLLGLADDVSDFDPSERRVRTVWRRERRRRISRTGTLWHDLAWFIVQQRVTTVDAGQQWRRLVEALGEPGPGPVELMAPPSPEVVASMHYTEFHGFGIERKRAEHLREAARIVNRFAGMTDGPFDAVGSKLATVRGIGPWTVSCLAAHTWGDADAVIVGDDGIPSMVTWFLADIANGDDATMLELLEPYRPHRGRVVHLAFASGNGPPRRHHRYARNPIRHR